MKKKKKNKGAFPNTDIVGRLHMSFTYSINKAGPRIEPCGTPHDTFDCSELVSLIHTF